MRLAISLHAPMKTKYLKSLILENKQRGSVALLFFVCLILLTMTPGAAQLRNQRRVTALQLGTAPEGSRVTIVSDSPLNDYEAFRRGDRFYVKIPLAALFSAVPHLLADGFADVQVQRVGDGLIVSFKLQPGATARVEQHANRLDVVFSAPNKYAYNNLANVGSNPATSRTSGIPSIVTPQPYRDRGPDTAGPMPPGSALASRERLVAEGPVDINGAAENPRWPSNLRTSSRQGGNSQPTIANRAITSPSPGSSPSSILTPSTSYAPLTTATPASARPVSGSSVPGGDRQALAWRWISANRLATLLGVLILLSLVLYLATAIRRKRKTVVTAKREKAPKVQPKYSPSSELNELSTTRINEQVLPRYGASQPPSNTPSSAPAPSAATSPSQHSPWVLAKPAILPPTVGYGEHGSEEQEREVFEL